MRGFLQSRVLHRVKLFALSGVILAFTQLVWAVDLNSAVGYWQTVDTKTNQKSSIIQIWQDKKNSKYYGKIYKIFAEDGHKTTDLCTHCKDGQKNKPMLGLTIIRNMTYRNGKYVDGRILDPRDGKEYKSKMWLANDGQTLKLRGYIGLPLFGKTTEWQRASEKDI